MSIDPLTAALELGTSVINKIWPDPVKQAEEQRKLQELYQTGDLVKLNAEVQLMISQIKVNEAQANHKSIFVAGARPFVIWVGGFALAWSGVFHPILTWVWAFADISGTPPPLMESGLLGTIVTGLLGVGGMRSFDKKQGTQTDSIRKSK